MPSRSATRAMIRVVPAEQMTRSVNVKTGSFAYERALVLNS
jgi:hypothetical protein